MTVRRLFTVRSAVVFGLFLAAMKGFGQTAGAQSPPSRASGTAAIVDDDSQDVIYLAPNHPVFLRLHIQVDNSGFQSLRDKQLRRLFNELDADKDGVLNANEAKELPNPRQLTPPGDMPVPEPTFQPADVDRAPADGNVSFEEFTEYVLRSIGKAFAVESETTMQSATAMQQEITPTGLFALFDVDSDGGLSAAELSGVSRMLRKFDANDDEILSQQELSFIAPADGDMYDAGGNDSELQLLQIDPERQDRAPVRTRRLVDQLLIRYAESNGNEGTSPKDDPPGLTNRVLSIDADRFRALDGDADGLLSAAELAALVDDPIPHAELLIKLGRRSLSPAEFVVLNKSAACPLDVKVVSGGDSDAALVIGASRLNLQSTSNPIPIFSRRLVRGAFQAADADTNQYLDENEYQQVGLAASAFAAIDADGNGQVTETELVIYVELHYLLGRSQTLMFISANRQTLFTHIDANGDNRLSSRELHRAGENLAPLDVNGDDRLDAADLVVELTATIQVGRSYLFARRPVMPAVRTDRNYGSAQQDSQRTGPTWFLKMDRNGDGDVSKREFLGPTSEFDKLDVDKDGLLDAEEASAATSSAEQSAPDPAR